MTRLTFVRRGILNETRGFAQSLLWATLATVLATAARLALDRWVAGLPYMTYFPAVLVAALFLGWRWGVAVVAASSLAADYLFIGPSYEWSFEPHNLVGSLSFALSAGILVVTAEALRAAVKEIDQAARTEAALNAELQHRVKNNLAVVQGLARQTAKAVGASEAFYEAFRGRLIALAQAHNVLASGRWEECHLPELVYAALDAFLQGPITIEGPRCALPSASCVPLVLALHELSTNAVKHGALSEPSGQVSLTWTVNEGRMVMRWVERGGPKVEAPTRTGLGSRLLSRQSGLDAVDLKFHETGVECELTIIGAKAVNA